ncbi:MAG: hypothetical protein RLZZ526_753 [Actinomycetota bacterium]
MTFYFEFDEAEAFATGAIGNPGERTFYLQVRAEGRTISVKCEKAQVAQMAEYLRGMLSDLPEPKQMPSIDTARLKGPVEQDFVLGTIGLGIDRSSMKMIVQLEEMPVVDFDDEEADANIDEFMLDDDDDESTASVVRVLLNPDQARAFCDMADLTVNAGRMPCKWCGAPQDPSGHACPKMN